MALGVGLEHFAKRLDAGPLAPQDGRLAGFGQLDFGQKKGHGFTVAFGQQRQQRIIGALRGRFGDRCSARNRSKSTENPFVEITLK